MSECMMFPDTVEEFMEQYKVVDTDGIYMSKGVELVPIFRMRQWFENIPSTQPQREMGRWLTTDAYPHKVYCSECYKTFAQTYWLVWVDGTLPRNFCPNCGAKMEEGES